MFHSISNTQNGLRGISFGNFLIKQVVEELLREFPGLKCFATLSPVPGFAAWFDSQRETANGNGPAPQLFNLLSDDAWPNLPETRNTVQPMLEQAAAIYLLEAKADNGKPADPVARFHLYNGAALERINFCGDLSAKGLHQSHGIMVNDLYDLDAIERNHEQYANAGEVSASAQVRKLLPPDAKPRARGLPSILQRQTARKDAAR